MLEVTSVQIAAIMLLFTAGGAMFALFRLVTNTAEAVRKELMAELDKHDAVATKSRHDEKGNTTTVIMRLEGEVDRLKRETVRREDMTAIETRLTAAVVKIESKVDQITDKLAGFRILERQVESIDARLQLAVDRFLPGTPPPPAKDRPA